MLTVLDAVLAKLPPPVLASRYSNAVAVLSAAADAAAGDAAGTRAAAGCLASALAAGGGEWPTAAPLLAKLAGLCLDARPKPRRRAAAGLASALASLARTPAALHAADAVVRLAADVLPAPEAAAAAVKGAPSSRRADADAALARAMTDALHLLGALAPILPLLPAPNAARCTGLVLPLAGSPHPLLARHAADVLAALFASPACPLPPPALDDAVRALAAARTPLDARDVGVAAARAAALRAGVAALARVDARAAAAALPAVVDAMAPMLAADGAGIKAAAAAAVTGCIADAAGAAGTLAPSSARAPAPAAARTATVLAATLAPDARNGWAASLPCAAAFFDAVGAEGARAAAPLVARVGALAGGAADAAARGDAPPDFAAPAAAAIGAALRSLGPDAVLAVLPLNLDAALDGDEAAEPRTWLLPLLRSAVRGVRLATWCEDLLPVARSMGARAAKARAASGPRAATLAQRCAALEAQLWGALPSFASWAVDGGDALR